MIDLHGMISMSYLKKSRFTGSCLGMRYVLRKKENIIEKTQEGAPAETETVLQAVIWPEPLNYENTTEDKKHSMEFPFSQDGLSAAVAWLNEEYEAGHY